VAARRVQSLAANAHQYLTPEDWTRENAEEFLEDLKSLRSNAKKLMMTVLVEVCQPSMRKAIQVADRQMEEAYIMAKNVAVNLLKKHRAAKKERNRILAENEEYDEDYSTRNGTPTDWEATSNIQGGERGQCSRECECHTENKLSDNKESNCQDNDTGPPGDSQFRPLEVTVMSGCGRGLDQIQRVMTDREVGFVGQLGAQNRRQPMQPLSSTIGGNSHISMMLRNERTPELKRLG